ncbi:MAG: T9SS type A sorting domain-containing protein [Bacteroidota bacterium]
MNFCNHCAIFRKASLVMALVFVILILVITGNRVSAATDTTWSVTFQVNMAKAVKQNIFHPATDSVFVILDHGILPMKLVAGPGYTYSGALYNALDSTATYSIKFRINGSTLETVNRSLSPQPGMSNVSVWWNNDPLNITTFIVSMQYVPPTFFNPSNDSIVIVGTMNDMKGSPRMTRIGTTLNYSLDYILDPGSVQQYKYRINQGDSSKGQVELLYLPNRMLRVPDTLVTVTDDFNNNYNPAVRLMTFKCNMGYYIKTHRFNIADDYLEVAGNFNNGGGNDVLFKGSSDSTYSLAKYLDTAYIHQGPLTFKFRIRGGRNTQELVGKADRNYPFHDTTGQGPNLFSCYFNNMNPSTPTPPWAYDLSIQGTLVNQYIVNGVYTYENLNGIREDSSTYRWLRSPDSLGTNAVAIDTSLTYKIDTVDVGKWLVFEVTPRAASGDSATGKAVRVVSVTRIGGVGMTEQSILITKVYPNPVNDYLTIEATKEIEQLELFSLSGQSVVLAEGLHARGIRIPVSHLPRGVYLLKATAKSHEWGVVQVVKN